MSQFLDGYRIKVKDERGVYLVFGEKKHLIPDEGTYNHLFENWKDIRTVSKSEFDGVETGDSIDSGAVLAKGSTAAVYLISMAGQKLHIEHKETMDKFDFDWKKVKAVPEILIADIPAGESIS